MGRPHPNRGEAQSSTELAQIRQEELSAANAILGVTRWEQLNYPDGQLQYQNFYDLTGIIVRYIRFWRPQVILTFGPEGGVNLHRDHTIASLATTAAFHHAGRSQSYQEVALGAYSPQKLYYCSPPFLVGGSDEKVPQTPYSLTLQLDKWKERKIEAFRAHRSQAPILERLGDTVLKRFSVEHYLLVAINSDKPFPIGDDNAFFFGVKED